MGTIIHPDHFNGYQLQADDRLNELGKEKEKLEVMLQRLIQEDCLSPTVAQHHIDAFIDTLPHYTPGSVLDAVYALQTLVRTRQAVAALMTFGSHSLTTMNEALLSQNELQSSTGRRSARDEIFLMSAWNDPHVQFLEDLQHQTHRLNVIYKDNMGTLDEMEPRPSDQHNPLDCFRLATRQLSIRIINMCSGQYNTTQLKAIENNDFQRLEPLFDTQPYSMKTLKAVAVGLITDMNALPMPDDDHDDDTSSED